MSTAALKPLVPSEMSPVLNPILITDAAGLSQVEDFLTRVFVFGLDTETNVVPTFFNRRIRTIQVGDKNEQYVIDLLALCGSTENLINWQGFFGKRIPADSLLRRLVNILRRALESKQYLKVGTNLQFDYMVLKWNLGLRPWNFYDCLLAEKVRWAGLVDFFLPNFWALDDMVRRYCGLLISKDEQKGFDLETPLTQRQIDYAALDTRLVLAVKAGQFPHLQNNGLMRAATIEFDAAPAFGDMHLNGLKIDTDKWMGLVNEIEANKNAVIAALDKFFIPTVGQKGVPNVDLVELERVWRESPSKTDEQKAARAEARKAFMVARKAVNDAVKMADTYEGEAAINYGSNAQLKEALLKMKVNGKRRFTPSQVTDTNDQTLKKIAEHYDWDCGKVFKKDACKLDECGVIDLIRLYRETNKVMTTYGSVFLEKYIDKDTGRVHSNISQLGAATGRTSSSKPNVQNILRGKEWRHCFVAREGYSMATLDYSGCELRILAELSGEKVWIDAFNNGWDVHSVGAEIMFGEEWKQGTEPGCKYYAPDENGNQKHEKCDCKVHGELRSRAKNLNFGIAYGLGYKKFAEDCNMRREDGELDLALAKDILENKYKKSFPAVIAYLDESGKNAQIKMEARTMAGSRRGFTKPDWNDAAQKIAAELKRVPTTEEIKKKYKGMYASIEREGKNTPIQGTNAYMIKLAMGCGYDPNGKPYLWHILEPQFDAMLENMVHDELVVECETEKSQAVYEATGDAMSRAGAEFVKRIKMTYEGKIASHWSK